MQNKLYKWWQRHLLQEWLKPSSAVCVPERNQHRE
jgi:hypothetical protein